MSILNKSLKCALKGIFGALFKVRLRGHLQSLTTGEKTLIISNHESWLDGLLLGLFLPGKPVFVVYRGLLGVPLFRLALRLVDHVALDTASPMAMKRVVELLKSGRPVVIFPEGRLTTTGALMKVYDGPAFAALKSEATVVPVALRGAGRSMFTRLEGKHPRSWFPAVTLDVQAPTRIAVQDVANGRERRRLAGEAMRHIMQEMMLMSAQKQTLYQTFVSATETFGKRREILVDVKQLESPLKTQDAEFSAWENLRRRFGLGWTVNTVAKDYSYADLLKMTLALGRVVAKNTAPCETVGVLLPNLAVTLAVVLGASSRGRVPAMLNYKAGTTGLLDACVASNLKTVLTSKAFIEKGKLQAEEASLRQAGLRLVYLEDARADFGLQDKLATALELLRPRRVEQDQSLERPAVVLFTSGSEGKPKGVVLSHRAIASNIEQVRAVFDFNAEDRALNALPIFHSFGLTGGTLLPLFSGIHLVLYATPLHYRVIPELAYDKGTTVLFGTNTFLANYGKHANPYDFFRLRFVVAGAEKLQGSVRDLWFEKFGKRIFEGYGATETAPVLAVNTPKAYRIGTVGQFLPGIDYQLVPVPGIEHGGALHVKGPNVMTGYYRYEAPGVLEPTSSEMGPGWYATGDIVRIDDGFVTIVDRVKRFAKIGGEMVSLSVVEKIASLAGSGLHAATTVSDAAKGEALVLFTTNPALTREVLSAAAKEAGISELAVPKKIVAVAALPLLGTGKTDYVALKKMAASQ